MLVFRGVNFTNLWGSGVTGMFFFQKFPCMCKITVRVWCGWCFWWGFSFQKSCWHPRDSSINNGFCCSIGTYRMFFGFEQIIANISLVTVHRNLTLPGSPKGSWWREIPFLWQTGVYQAKMTWNRFLLKFLEEIEIVSPPWFLVVWYMLKMCFFLKVRYNMLVLCRVTMFLIPYFLFVGSKPNNPLVASFCVIFVDAFNRKPWVAKDFSTQRKPNTFKQETQRQVSHR